MTPIKLSVVGAGGRVGAMLLSLIAESQELELTAAIVSASSRLVGLVALEGARNNGRNVHYRSDIAAACADAQVVIDFSTRSASLELVRECAARAVPCLVATTGHDEAERVVIAECAKKTPILLAPNTSLGIYTLHKLSVMAKRILGEEFAVEIVEMHHDQKRDAPSGTALSIARALERECGLTIAPRDSEHQQRKTNEVGVAFVRAGDIPGEHLVMLAGQGERIEIVHRARDRAIFARGALALAPMLLRKAAGLYSVADLLDPK